LWKVFWEKGVGSKTSLQQRENSFEKSMNLGLYRDGSNF
jgi:hypothetical protein